MAKYCSYTTKEGDSFDMIALHYYNEEKLASYLIDANPNYADVVVFDGGVKLLVPIIEDEDSVETVPPWRRNV